MAAAPRYEVVWSRPGDDERLCCVAPIRVLAARLISGMRVSDYLVVHSLRRLKDDGKR